MNRNQNNILPSHFREFIEALNKNEVEYLVIGGYAVGSYGHIRSTGDLDIFIHATDENAQKAISACISYGIPKASIQKEMFLIPKIIGIGDPPLRIEILKHLDVIDFGYAYKRAKQTTIDGVQIQVISLDDLILLKEAATRDRSQSRDTEDLEYLKKIKNKQSTKK